MDLVRAARMSILLPPPPPGRPGDPGLFGPGSQAWRIGRERVVLAGGPAALLLQVAHPLVAAGVGEHSDFREDPLLRLRGTVETTLSVTLGDTEQAEAAAARVRRVHERVRGRAVPAGGRYPSGTPYDANAPELDLWVHATLVWTALRAYATFVGPLTGEDRDRYVAEMRRFARLFGVAEGAAPGDHAELERYVATAIADGTVAVGGPARALAPDILGGGFPVPGPLATVRDSLVAGLLPETVRDAYGLAWGRRERAVFETLRRGVRTGLPLVPARVRFWPHYRTALRRAGARVG